MIARCARSREEVIPRTLLYFVTLSRNSATITDLFGSRNGSVNWS
jgi:hypothetical protein